MALQRRTLIDGIHASTTDVAKRIRQRENGPDLLIYTERCIAGEVTVAHQSLKHDRNNTTQRTTYKTRKYTELSTRTSWQIAPIVLTSLGTIAAETMKWLTSFAKYTRKPGLKVRLTKVMSIAVLRGNFDVFDFVQNNPYAHLSSPTPQADVDSDNADHPI